MKFLVRIVSNAVALWVATALLSGVTILTGTSTTINSLGDTAASAIYLLIAGAILAAVNTVVRPIVKLLSLPFYVLTLGLFFIVVNALMIMLTAAVSEAVGGGIAVESYWWAAGAAVVVGIVNWVIDLVLVPGNLK
ncbi:MAG: phage holin family protein [Actinomycetaceae bacterium]|nr:phage holin family protein [Actinomycetaceae bacterium]